MWDFRLLWMLRKDQFDAPHKLHTATLSAQPVQFAEVDGTKKAPDWIPLIPAGQLVIARDGRTFIPDHTTAIANFNRMGMAIPLDWDHSLDSWGVAPGESKAAAWIDQLEARDGALWGHIEVWTARGRESVESREYRYISPVIMFDDDRRVVEVPRASLVNNPALVMPALLSRENPMNEKLFALLASFGLDPANVTEAQLQEVQETFARGKAPVVVPSLETHVPVEQYESVVVELAQVKAQIETYVEQAQAARVDQVIKEALSSGRLLPSERAFFEAQARKDLPEVEKFLATRAPRVTPHKSGPASVSEQHGLTELEQLTAKKSGLTNAQFAAAKAAHQKV
jgi:phage I-like protein